MSGTLEQGEFHPAANSAFVYCKNALKYKPFLMEAFASTALSGNRTAELCYETARRLLDNEPISDRYLLGLAWTIKEMDDTQSLDRL